METWLRFCTFFKVENKIFEREGDDKTIDTDQVSHLAPGLGQITYLEIGG